MFNQIISALNPHDSKVQITKDTQYLFAQEFFKACKQYVQGSSDVDANVDFMNSCNQMNVSAFPLFTRIKNQVLHLVGYRIKEGQATALAKYIK